MDFMDATAALDTGEGILDAVGAAYARTVADNALIFRLAFDFATVSNEDAMQHGRVLPGAERAVRIGGVGTPKVLEFAAADFGVRMQLGMVAAEHYLADALDVWHRLPLIAARVDAGEVKIPLVRQVAQQTRHLSVEAAGFVDAEMAESVDGRLAFSRFVDVLAGKVKAADPELAEQREREAAERQFARKSRNTVEGMGTFVARAPVAWVVGFDASVDYLAQALQALGDGEDLEARRVKAFAILANPMQAVELLAAFAAKRSETADEPLPIDEHRDEEVAAGDDANDDSSEHTPDLSAASTADTPDDAPAQPTEPELFPPTGFPTWLRDLVLGHRPGKGYRGVSWSKLLPRVQMFVHVARETLEAGDGVTRWEGHGALTLDYLRRHVAPFQHCTIREVIDLDGQEPVDAYEIPARHRRAVHLRTPADCFPFATTTGEVEIDHTQAYDPTSGVAGQSSLDNYGPLGKRHHRVKTHGHWQVVQPFPGVYVWRDGYGRFHLVDHTGTRTAQQELAAPKSRPVYIEIYRTPGVNYVLTA